MNILFLHLSDIHIENKYSINQLHITKIVHAVRANAPFDHMFLILSGDVAYSGQENQYAAAYSMIGRLINLMKSECNYTGKVEILIVPGNHDVDLSMNPLTTGDLVSLRKSGEYYNKIDSELKRQTHFFNFANRNNLFRKNKLFEQKIYDISGSFSVEVNLINSALFSTLEEDKGLHFLPQEVIQSVNNPTGADFVLTIMHHPTDWFIDSTMQALDNVLYSKSSLVFYGHKHYQAASIVINEQDRGTLVHAGGCLSERSDWSSSQFILGKLTVSEKDVKYNYNLWNYKWNLQQRQYETENVKTYILSKKPSKERDLIICTEYYEKMLNDVKQESFNDFTRYFVFPRVETSGLPLNQTKEFITDEDFVKEILVKKKVMIYGQYNTGKTTMLKWLFLRMTEKGYVPIICDLGNIQGSPKRIIKNCFEDIYSEELSDFQRFQQLPREKKVLIIDDIDLIKPDHFEKLVESVHDEFSYFIFASKENFDLDMIERMKSYLRTTDSIYKYQLTMFFSDKRNELVQKAVDLHISDQSIAGRVVNSITEAIKSQKRLIRFDPDFILKYVSYYCKNVGDATFRTTNIFSKVFEANLVNSLHKHSAKISVEKAFMLLSSIAYNVHFQKIYPIRLELIVESIKIYNVEYGSDVSHQEAIGLFVKSKILIPIDGEVDGFRFANKSYLAFFVARRLNIQYHETGDDRDLQYIIKNTCFGINADILLFITYITDNVRILRFILDMVDSYTEEWIEFSLSNVPAFMKRAKHHEVNIPDKDTYDKHQIAEISEEKEVQTEIETLNLYEYSDEEAEKDLNRILRAIQLMSIVSRCLPIFEHIMKKDEKDRFIKQIYGLPNKIFQVWASRIDEGTDELIQYFKDQPDQYYAKQKQVSTEDIIKALQWSAMSFLLDLYRMSMGQAAKEHTLSYILGFSTENSDNQLYELQKLIALEVQGNPNHFITDAIDLNNRAKEPLLKVMVRRVASNASVFKKMDFKDNQKLRTAFFNDNQQQHQRMLIQRLRHKKHMDE